MSLFTQTESGSDTEFRDCRSCHENLKEAGERSEFKRRQAEYFTDLLARKWECETPGHTVCLCTADGKHHVVSEAGVIAWVNDLCLGKATTLRPPATVLAPAVKRVRSTDGSSTLRTIPFVPSRRRMRSPIFAASASLREKLQLTVSLSSLPSSGVPGVGYYSGKAMKWLGERSLDAVDDLVIFKRTLQYLNWLDEREKEINRCSLPKTLVIEDATRMKLIKILEDALEMSRACYAKSVNACAAALGWKIIDWLDCTSNVALAEEAASLCSHIHCCLSVLHLTQDIRRDQCETEFAEELLDALTRVPLALRGEENVSTVICLLAKELAFAPHTPNHRWLGYHFGCIINRTLRVRPLTVVELAAIRDMAFRRLDQSGDDWPMVSRPWEILIFLDCASQTSWFEDIVLQPQGLQSLLIALEAVLWRADLHDDDDCAHLDDILRVLWMLSPRYADTIGTAPGIVNLLLRAFRRSRSEEWFYSQCWVIRIIRQVVSHRPQLLHAMVRKRAPAAFASFVRGPAPQGLTRNDKRFRKEAIDDARRLLGEMNALHS